MSLTSAARTAGSAISGAVVVSVISVLPRPSQHEIDEDALGSGGRRDVDRRAVRARVGRDRGEGDSPHRDESLGRREMLS